jgi:hypothetical protein
MNEKIKKYLIYIVLFSVFFGLTYLLIPSLAFAAMIALILLVFVK